MKRNGKIVSRGQHRLAGIGVGWIGGELAHAVEERRQRSSHALSRIRKNTFDLVQRVELGLRITLLLSLFVDSQLQQFIANALKLLAESLRRRRSTPFSWKVGASFSTATWRLYPGVFTLAMLLVVTLKRSLISLEGLDRDR